MTDRSVTVPREGHPLTPERLIELSRVARAVPSPCGHWMACEVQRLDRHKAAYVTDLWRVPLDGSPATPLTRGEAQDRNPRFAANGDLLFVSNRPAEEGGEGRPLAQIWLLPATGGEPRPLTDEPLGVSDFRLGGDRLVVLADRLPGVEAEAQRKTGRERAERGPSTLRYTAMPVRYWDHWLPEAVPHVVVYDALGGSGRDLTPDEIRGRYRRADFDVDAKGQRAVITVNRRGADRVPERALEVLDLDTGERRSLLSLPRTEHEGPRFDPEGRHIVCVRHQRVDDRVGRPVLWCVAVDRTDTGRVLAEGFDRWPTPACWRPDGQAVLVTCDDEGDVAVYEVPLTEGAPTRLTPETGSHASIAITERPDGPALVGLRHSLTRPPTPFIRALEGGPVAYLDSPCAFDADRAASRVKVESITVEGADGAPVQSFVITPTAPVDGPRPLVVMVHGGPLSMHTNGWHWRWNALTAAERGFIVALPNPRGSTGFGQDFIEGIWNNAWGAACYEDVEAVTDALEQRSDVDADRMVLMGGSFGGYMTNWIGGHTDRYCCLISHAGLYNLPAFHGVTDEPGWFALQFGGPPDELGDAFSLHSPHRFLGEWKTPTLITHGEKDYRVPISEALALFEGLQRKGVESELLVFPDENHWVLKPRNIVAWYDAWMTFAERYFPKEG